MDTKLVNVTAKRLLKLPEPVFRGLLEKPTRSYELENTWLGVTVVYNLDRVSVAKAYAAFKGHSGALGGWIYNSEGRALTQGWISYFNRFWYTGMQAWIKRERLKNAGKL